MSTNKTFWRVWLEGRQEKKTTDGKQKDETNVDTLEEGLKELSWIDSRKAAVRRIRKKAQSLGEEIGNTISHGVMAAFMICILPIAAIRAYNTAEAGHEVLDAFAMSVFVIGVFLMFMASTIYHAMQYGSKQKEIMNKLDHIMIYYAIAGTYTPIALTVIGGAWGIGLCIAQWALVIAGTLFKALAFSKTRRSYIFTVAIYLLMGWMIVLCFPIFYRAATPATFWLILSGGLCYTSGIVSFAMHFKFSHMVWHVLVAFGAICHVLAIVFFS